MKPRFSVRTLLVAVLVVAGYFGAWQLTKQAAVNLSREKTVHEVYSPCPFILRVDGYEDDLLAEIEVYPIVEEWMQVWGGSLKGPRRYNVWFFGVVLELPWVSRWGEEWKVQGGVI